MSEIIESKESLIIKKLKLIFKPITKNKKGMALEIERKNTLTNELTFKSLALTSFLILR